MRTRRYTVVRSDTTGHLDYQLVEAGDPSLARLLVHDRQDGEYGVEYHYPGLVFEGWIDAAEEK